VSVNYNHHSLPINGGVLDLAEAGHDGTLIELVKLTFEHVSKHVANEASTVTAMAQRVYPELEIIESIA
jgi:hypothetical protein